MCHRSLLPEAVTALCNSAIIHARGLDVLRIGGGASFDIDIFRTDFARRSP
jgi:hypothetical protein